MNKILTKLDTALQTLWVGGLWVVGYLVVPILFGSLDDRRLAGELAGSIFSAISILGLFCGTYLLLRAKWMAPQTNRIWALLVMLLITAATLLVLQPMMQELKASGIVSGSEAAAQFARLHGVSSVLYLLLSLLGLYLIVASSKKKDE